MRIVSPLVATPWYILMPELFQRHFSSRSDLRQFFHFPPLPDNDRPWNFPDDFPRFRDNIPRFQECESVWYFHNLCLMLIDMQPQALWYFPDPVHHRLQIFFVRMNDYPIVHVDIVSVALHYGFAICVDLGRKINAGYLWYRQPDSHLNSLVTSLVTYD